MAKNYKSAKKGMAPKMGGKSGGGNMAEVGWSGSMKNTVSGNTGKPGSISQR